MDLAEWARERVEDEDEEDEDDDEDDDDALHCRLPPALPTLVPAEGRDGFIGGSRLLLPFRVPSRVSRAARFSVVGSAGASPSLCIRVHLRFHRLDAGCWMRPASREGRGEESMG